MKLTSKLKVINKLGLHARPAMLIVKLLQNYQSDVFFTYNQMNVNARSIMSILALAASHNTHINVTVEGVDAEEVLNHLHSAFNNGFGE